MKFELNTLVALLLSSTLTIAHPQPVVDGEVQLLSREHAEVLDTRNAGPFADMSKFWKRKGGGGGGGKGGSSSGSSSSGKGGSSSSGRGSSSSSTGGSTKTGSGVTPNYGGGRYYGGGATTPYKSGGRSPLGIAAIPLAVGAGALAFYPGLWLYGAYAYPYSHPYSFHNRTARNTSNSTSTKRDIDAEYTLPTLLVRQTIDEGMNETKPVTCLCAMYYECGCDDSGNTTFLDSIIGDGTYANLNKSLVNVADINGTSTIVLNGTLPNGTTASGGTDNANAAMRSITQAGGYWVMIAIVGMTVYFV